MAGLETMAQLYAHDNIRLGLLLARKTIIYFGFVSLPIFAARMKSLSVSPLILCVQITTRTLPQAKWMSG